jgi:hypothetical protein
MYGVIKYSKYVPFAIPIHSIFVSDYLFWVEYSAQRVIFRNIKMDLREIGWGGMDWIDLAQDRDQWKALVNTVMNLRFYSLLGMS